MRLSLPDRSFLWANKSILGSCRRCRWRDRVSDSPAESAAQAPVDMYAHNTAYGLDEQLFISRISACCYANND